MRYYELFESGPSDKTVAALTDLQNFMARKSGGQWRGISREGNSAEIEVRNWGSWEVPYDADDEEDYDHEVLTDDSYEYLNKCIAAVNKKYPELEVYSVGSEKRWLVFRASVKKVAQVASKPDQTDPDAELKQTLTQLKQAMEAVSPNRRWDPIDELDRGVWVMNVKDWGEWSASGAMMPDTASALHDIMMRVKKANPRVDLTHRVSESNWLTFQAEFKPGA